MASISKRNWTTRLGEDKSAWVLSYMDRDGKRRRKQFERKKDAEAYETRVRHEVAIGIHTPDSQSITVEQAARIWLQACERGRGGRDPVELHTWRPYESHVRIHIVPLIGDKQLSKISTPDVNNFRDALLKKCSRAMAKKVLASFKSIIAEAQGRGLIAQNVALPVSIHKSGRHKKIVQIPSKTEVGQILSYAEARQTTKYWHRYHAFLFTAISTGMRLGELRGLYWEDVDLEEGVVRVQRRADEKGNIGSPKSAAGRREIIISNNLINILKIWKLACPPGRLVFPNWQGRTENHANIHNRCWKVVCSDLGLVDGNGKAKYTFHHLRHFRASMLIADGATAKEVMVEIGHSSIQLTFDTYGHLFPEDKSERKARADRLDGYIAG